MKARGLSFKVRKTKGSEPRAGRTGYVSRSNSRVEEVTTTNLERDYYEEVSSARGRRNG
jgi:hypothetical protein